MIEVASQGCISIVSTGLPQRRARAAHLRRHVCQKGNASENVFSPEKINGTQVKNKDSTRGDNDLFLTKVLDKPDLRSEVKSKYQVQV